uniref:Uncharacterized protein n=1 Tax=Arundo donax TaxID=35708 RepID=A0A0A8ZHS8_ARUDO
MSPFLSTHTADGGELRNGCGC